MDFCIISTHNFQDDERKPLLSFALWRGEKKKTGHWLKKTGLWPRWRWKRVFFPFLLFVNFADAQSMRRPARVLCSESFSASTGLQPARLDWSLPPSHPEARSVRLPCTLLPLFLAPSSSSLAPSLLPLLSLSLSLCLSPSGLSKQDEVVLISGLFIIVGAVACAASLALFFQIA